MEPPRRRRKDGRWVISLPDGRKILGDACWFDDENPRIRLLPADRLEPELVARPRSYAYLQAVGVAMALARDLDTCCALLRGDPVDPARLDPAELDRAQQRKLVRLDLSAFDLIPFPTLARELKAA